MEGFPHPLPTRLVAFDTETTGIDPASCGMTEIAGVLFGLDGSVRGRFSELCHPGRPVPLATVRLNGIDDRTVMAARPAIEVVRSFLRFAEGALLVAHNAGFDGAFLAAALAESGEPVPDLLLLDTLGFAQRALVLPNYRLGTVAQALGHRMEHSHRAAPDAEAVKHVFLELAERRSLRSLASIVAAAPTVRLPECASSAIHLPPGFERLPALVANRREVMIVYEGGSKGLHPRSITPLGLMSVHGATYLRALCHRDQIEKSFRVDRIRRLID